MQLSEIKRIMKKYKEVFNNLENYDKTRELPFQRKRIDITLSVATINKLKKIKEKTGKAISQIIEEKVGWIYILIFSINFSSIVFVSEATFFKW